MVNNIIVNLVAYMFIIPDYAVKCNEVFLI